MKEKSPRGKRKLFELTHPQKRIWYIENMYSGSTMYNIGGTTKIQGIVDLSVLEKALNLLIKNNDAVRLKLYEEDGVPSQYVEEYEYVKMDIHYFKNEEEFVKWEKDQMKIPFQLVGHNLFHFELYQIQGEISGYLVKMHHIICDGWTISILAEQVCKAYEDIINGKEFILEPPKSYLSYLEEEKEYLSTQRFEKNKKFWMEMYQNIDTLTLKGTSNEVKGNRKSYTIPLDLSCKLKEWTKENHITLNSFFISLFYIYLYKVTGERDIVFGLPVMNRINHQWKQVVGMLTSTMPFRYQINPQLTAMDMLKDIGRKVNKCLYNQKYPYDLLVQNLELRKRNISNLFDISINYYNTKPNTNVNGMTIENREIYNGEQVYSLQMIIRDWTDMGTLTLDFDYKVSDYDEDEVDEMYQALMYLAKQVMSDEMQEVQKLKVFSDDYLESITHIFNQTKSEYPCDKNIIQILEEQVKLTPDKVALSCGVEILTYLEFNKKVNQFARKLRSLGCKQGTIVAIYAERSIDTVIGIYGVLKAGAAYLPIDATTPIDRITFMLSDAGVRYLLTNLNVDFVNSEKIHVLNFNNLSYLTEREDNLREYSKPKDLAYIIYTSGSTGTPKGVMIENRGLVNYIWWAKKKYVLSQEEVMPLYSSLSFDLTVTSIFMPLISGNELRVYEEDAKEFVLFKILRENRVTIIKLTPAHLSLMKEFDLSQSKVNTMIVGGEDLRTSLAEQIYTAYNQKVRIFNEYGPTETVVGCMIYLYSLADKHKSVPIGVPADNVQIYVLNEQLEPVPRGAIGEIYISGDGVARGYLNCDELNQEKFLENPFLEGYRMYKTGDLGRFRGSDLEYVGRIDSQVKIHGYRIELGEIEKQLLNLPEIKDAVVCDYEKEGHDKVLCAYVVLGEKISSNEIKDRIMKTLPDYMIPQYITELDRLPLTNNGKIDRKKLPVPDFGEGIVEHQEQPNSEEEKVLLSEVLSVLSIANASTTSSFFQLGGDSIKAILISSKLREKGYELGVSDIIRHPILKEMALYMRKTKVEVVEKEICSGAIRNTPIMEWFQEQRFGNQNFYTQACIVEIPNQISVNNMNAILDEIVGIHDCLRINYSFEENKFFYNDLHNQRKFSIEEYDLTMLSYEVQQEKITELKGQLDRSFDISKEVLMKACLCKVNTEKKLLLLVIHHLAVDGISWRIILDDLDVMLSQTVEGRTVGVTSESCSYGRWAEKVFSYSESISNDEIAYWIEQDSIQDVFPVGNKLSRDINCIRNKVHFTLSKEDTTNLLTGCNVPYNTETKDILITSLLQTMKKYAKHNYMVIELEHHGRVNIGDKIDLSRTVGWFTSMYPFAVNMCKDDMGSQIKEVKEKLRQVPNHGVGYGILKYLTNKLKSDSQKHVRFNYLGEFKVENTNLPIKIVKQFDLGTDSKNDLTCLLEINCSILNGCLCVDIIFNDNEYTFDFMQKFIGDFEKNLILLIQYLIEKEDIDFTPSDFELDDFTQDDLDKLFLD